MFTTPANAQGASPGGGIMDVFTSMFPLLAIFAIFYFIVLRPQQQRMKALAQMISAVRRGDTVVTAGGLVGKVTKVIDDNEVLVEVADGVRVRVIKSTLAEVRSKGEPATTDTKSKSDDDK